MKNVNESGRSMVEMLGVLAIIGVLSIGGIAGYVRAMNTWKANEIIDAANRVVAMAETGTGEGADITYSGMGGTAANIAGGLVKEITAHGSMSTTSPSTVKITWKNGADVDAVKDIIEDKVGAATVDGEYTAGTLSGYTVSYETAAAGG